uniref:thiosulfate:glutathione sulfurtransferase-like n=1 Tax=Styela clava TaxID=7725 RepID=UPI00193ACF40|nr:thiosulfate:glutathione sulfurtransferase-like [Styela clava]
MRTIIFIISVLFLHGKCEQDQTIQDEKRPFEIPLLEFESVVKSGNALVIDVREPDEVYEVRVDAKNYVNVPLKQVGSSLQLSAGEFEKTYGVKKPSLDDDVVFICRSGKRSLTALKEARGLAFERSQHFVGGHLGWIANHPDLVVREKEENEKTSRKDEF